MTEDKALTLAVVYFVGHAYSELIAGMGNNNEWLALVKERVQALMPYIEKNKLSCKNDAERILKL